MKNLKKRKWVIVVSAVVLALCLMIGACTVYLRDYYPADLQAVGAFLPEGCTWKEDPDGLIVFEPAEATKGLIFYPGGKVEYTAYIPLMQALSEQGILCVLIEMPFHLAVLDINAADGIQEEYPHVQDWYIGGHSLGGSMAASYVSDHTDEYEGLILLGAYSTADLSRTDLTVLSVYGSEDRVMNRDKYEECRANLPANAAELVIDGGCHAYFGMYGPQEGDGIPSISREEQIRMTAERVGEVMASARTERHVSGFDTCGRENDFPYSCTFKNPEQPR